MHYQSIGHLYSTLAQPSVCAPTRFTRSVSFRDGAESGPSSTSKIHTQVCNCSKKAQVTEAGKTPWADPLGLTGKSHLSQILERSTGIFSGEEKKRQGMALRHREEPGQGALRRHGMFREGGGVWCVDGMTRDG